eukprot:4864679-Amphidinium_carterae.2
MEPSREEALGLTDVAKVMAGVGSGRGRSWSAGFRHGDAAHPYTLHPRFVAALRLIVSTSGVVWCRVGCLLELSQTVSS